MADPKNNPFEEENLNEMLQFDAPKNESSYIKVIGVGGGGGNAVNNMFRKGITGVDFIVTNTDQRALKASPVPVKIELGQLGAGNDPAVARQAALDHEEELKKALSHNTQMLFITAGMGGGTGTGAAPVIARIAKDIDLNDNVVNKILVVAVVTMPFYFEGRKRREQAFAGVEELRKHVDSILIINNDKLRDMGGNLRLTKGFEVADDVLLQAVKGIAEIITCSTYVGVDFRDVNSVMQNSGTALMGTGIGKGENRASEAIQAATTSVLLNDNDIRGAKNALLYITSHPDHQITFDELDEVTEHINGLIGNYDANIIWGTGEDESLGDELKITLIATGYDKSVDVVTGDKKEEKNKVGEIPETRQVEAPVAVTPAPQPADENGMRIVSKPADEAPMLEIRDTEPKDFVSHKPQAEPSAQRNVFSLDPLPEDSLADEAEEEAPADILDGMVLRSHSGVNVADAFVVSQPVTHEVLAAEPEALVETLVEAPVETPVMQHEAPKPVAIPSPATAYTTAPVSAPAPQEDLSVMDRAAKIRRIHDLLRNNPDGGTIVERMGAQALSEAAFDMPRTSAMAESRRTLLDTNGDMRDTDNRLFDLPD